MNRKIITIYYYIKISLLTQDSVLPPKNIKIHPLGFPTNH